MDRRTLLRMAASLPALAAGPTAACSVALRSPRMAGIEIDQVRKLFAAWWDRNETDFKALFINTLMDDGTPMEGGLARELLASDPLPPKTFAIFDQYFADRRKSKKLTLVVSTAVGIIVACSEADPILNVRPDCEGMPTLHLFLVTMNGLNPRSIVHIGKQETVEPGSHTIWADGQL